jgi:hypothetical protein
MAPRHGKSEKKHNDEHNRRRPTPEEVARTIGFVILALHVLHNGK